MVVGVLEQATRLRMLRADVDKDGTLIEGSLIVVAVGIAPNVGLAQDAGLNVGRGIVVDDMLQTSRAGIYAVGNPLDILVLMQDAVEPLTIVRARALGGLRMTDDKGGDDKIIAVCIDDPAFAQFSADFTNQDYSARIWALISISAGCPDVTSFRMSGETRNPSVTSRRVSEKSGPMTRSM